MPTMTNAPKVFNDQSLLTPGLHPAFLLAITDEATPEGWQMYEKSPRMWRWQFAVWDTPQTVTSDVPERQSAVSSQTFSPKGRQPASKAYAWTTALLGREIAVGESVDLDPLMPIPCMVSIERKNEYANIVGLFAWPEGAALLTPGLKDALAQFHQMPPTVQKTVQAPPPPQPQGQPTPQPGRQTWGQGAPTPPKRTW